MSFHLNLQIDWILSKEYLGKRIWIALKSRFAGQQKSAIFSDPDQIVRIDSSERIQLNELTREQNSRRSNNSGKNSKKHVTPRRREVLLSKISLYIVYMFVCCHRWVTNLQIEKDYRLWHNWVMLGTLTILSKKIR